MCVREDTGDATCVTKSVGTVSGDSQFGDTAWMNPDHVMMSDDKSSVAGNNTGVNGHLSHILRATNLRFTIPGPATITGIIVEVERSAGTTTVTDSLARLIKAAAIQITDRALSTPWQTTEGYVSYGSGFDLWGTTWSSTDINDPRFGFSIAAKAPAGNNMQAYINHIRIKVCYQL
jgi:hypothetical protein